MRWMRWMRWMRSEPRTRGTAPGAEGVGGRGRGRTHSKVLAAGCVAVCVAGCGYPVVGGVQACELGFTPNKPLVTGPSVIGQAYATCQVPPERHRMTVTLEYKAAGMPGWVTKADRSDDRIPGTGRTVYQVKAGCLPGAWRTKAHATGSLQGRTFDVSDTSIERRVAERDCR